MALLFLVWNSWTNPGIQTQRVWISQVPRLDRLVKGLSGTVFGDYNSIFSEAIPRQFSGNCETILMQFYGKSISIYCRRSWRRSRSQSESQPRRRHQSWPNPNINTNANLVVRSGPVITQFRFQCRRRSDLEPNPNTDVDADPDAVAYANPVPDPNANADADGKECWNMVTWTILRFGLT